MVVQAVALQVERNQCALHNRHNQRNLHNLHNLTNFLPD
jgi:hypothetical protein